MTALQPAPPRHRHRTAPLRIAMLGARGVPAASGGLGTAVQEVGQRLVEQGHRVTVYRRPAGGDAPPGRHGMHLVTVPALRAETLGHLSHAALSAAHLRASRRHDVAFVFGAANAPLVPLIRSRATAVAVHVGGLEWKRDRWGSWGRRYHRLAEEVAVREADALIADTRGIQDYYAQEFGIATDLIAYGARILTNSPTDLIEQVGLVPGHYHLVVARFEPEDHVDVIVEGYRRSGATMPLVVVGSAPTAYAERVRRLAEGDDRVRLLGGVDDQRMLDQLYAHALGSLHGHAVGGTDPSLLRAMGAGTAVVGWDVVCNREVAGTAGLYVSSPGQVAAAVEEVERYPFRFRDIGELMQERARERHDWDAVSEGYGSLAARLARGYSTRGLSSGRRAQSARRPDTDTGTAHG